MPRSFLTPAERRLLDNARPSERVILRDLFELLDARLVGEETEATAEPPVSSPTEPLFHTRREDAA